MTQAVCRPAIPFVNHRTDIHVWDIHVWDKTRDASKFTKKFVIRPNVDPAVRKRIVDIIETHWDCFYSAGVRHTILDFDFAIDTGGSSPVCCRKPHYGPHESKIIMEHINVLLANGWIHPCKGPWGSSIVLAAKPHQEHVTDIDDFVWRMCVSYRRLNQVTLPFEYPIPRCNDAIDNFGDSAGTGMGWILMQPDDSAASVRALALLRSEGICHFDVSMHGARLRPVRFGSRGCTEMESHLHSFVGEAGCGRWAISQNRKYLWGSEFFWMCDCSAVKEILEYKGPIHQIRCWAQELLGYHFQVFHRPARMFQ
jgi:hypothetical protein